MAASISATTTPIWVKTWISAASPSRVRRMTQPRTPGSPLMAASEPRQLLLAHVRSPLLSVPVDAAGPPHCMDSGAGRSGGAKKCTRRTFVPARPVYDSTGASRNLGGRPGERKASGGLFFAFRRPGRRARYLRRTEESRQLRRIPHQEFAGRRVPMAGCPAVPLSGGNLEGSVDRGRVFRGPRSRPVAELGRRRTE